MPGYRRVLATSDHWFARSARAVRRFFRNFAVPAPKPLVWPLVQLFLAIRSAWWFIRRVFIAEPFFKAQVTRYGKNLHTDIHLHWVVGRGHLILGDNVLVDGGCSFVFAARYSDTPTLTIGDNSGIGGGCSFTIAKRITIGRHVRIASAVQFFDSPGHPNDPDSRLAGAPAPDDDVRPITIEDNVWIGSRAIIYPGVTIGEGSVVAMGAVVMTSVPPRTLVAGNPARQLRSLAPAAESASPAR